MPRSLWTTTPLAPASWCSVKNAEIAASYLEKSRFDAPVAPLAGDESELLQAVIEKPSVPRSARRADKETRVSRCILRPYYILPRPLGTPSPGPVNRVAPRVRRCRGGLAATLPGSRV